MNALKVLTGILLFSLAVILWTMIAVDVTAETITVDDDGPANHTTIQAAIDDSSDGDTILVRAGTYSEEIRVDKRLSIRGGGNNSTIIDHNRTYFFIISTDGSNVSGFRIEDTRTYDSGISIQAANIKISENTFVSCGYGIRMDDATDCLIKDNQIQDSGWGIRMARSSGNTIQNCTLFNLSEEGLHLGSCHDNVVQNCHISDCSESAVFLAASERNTFLFNHLSSRYRKDIVMEEDSHDCEFHNNTGLANGVSIEDCDAPVLQGNTINASSHYPALELQNCPNAVIEGNTMRSGSGETLDLREGDNTWILNNTMNSDEAVNLKISSSTDLVVRGNTLSGYGLVIEGGAMDEWSHEIDESNTLNGSPIRYYLDSTDFSIPGDTSQAILVNCRDVSIEDITLSNVYNGIVCVYSSHLTFNRVDLIDGGGYGIRVLYSDNFSFTDVSAELFSTGLSIYADDCTFTSCISSNNTHSGLRMVGDRTLIDDCSFDGNQGTGLYIDGSDQVIMDSRVKWNSGTGIEMVYCDNGFISANEVMHNENGIILDSSSNNVLESNIILDHENGVLIESNRGNKILNCTIDQCLTNGISAFATCSDTIIRGNNITNCGEKAIHFISSDNCIIENNYFFNATHGIILENSADDNRILNNTIDQVTYHAVSCSDSDRVTIHGNTCLNRTDWDSGIELYSVTGFTITWNVIEGFHTGISVSGSDGVISNNQCTGAQNRGIYLSNSDAVEVANNTCMNSDFGIFTSGSTNMIVDQNICSNNERTGILVQSSDGITVTSNEIYENGYSGLSLMFCLNAYLTDNEIQDSGFMIDGNDLQYYETHTIDTSNSVDGRPIVFLKRTDQAEIPEDAAHIILVDCDDISMEGIDISNTTFGLIAVDCECLTVIGCTFSGNHEFGINLMTSHDCTIFQSHFSMNGNYGIKVTGTDGLSVMECDSNGNRVGIQFKETCRESQINSNRIMDNIEFGVSRSGSGTVFCQENWWGDATGPHNSYGNPDGTGDRVSNSVNFDDWLTSGEKRVHDIDKGWSFFRIDDAIEMADPGDTIELDPGLFLTDLLIDKEINIAGSGQEETLISIPSEEFESVISITSDHVTISDLSLQGWDPEGGRGIGDEEMAGILIDAEKARVFDVTFRDLTYGIYLLNSKNVFLDNNRFEDCGIMMDGEDPDHVNTHEITTNNKIITDGNPDGLSIQYITNQTDLSLPQDIGQLIMASCEGITITDLTIHDSAGIVLVHCNDITLNNCEVTSCCMGIIVGSGCTEIMIIESSIQNNRFEGLLIQNAESVLVRDCEFSGNTYGIYIDGGRDHEISDNLFTENSEAGLYIHQTSSDCIADNNIFKSNNNGIIINGDSNIADGNRCLNNENYGIECGHHAIVKNNYCSGNRIGIYFHSGTCDNNTCENDTSSGLYLQGTRNHIFTNSTFIGAPKGIVLWGYSHSNKFENCTIESGMFSDSKFNTLINCHLSGTFTFQSWSSGSQIHSCNIYYDSIWNVGHEGSSVNATDNWWGTEDGKDNGEWVTSDPWLTKPFDYFLPVAILSADPEDPLEGDTVTLMFSSICYTPIDRFVCTVQGMGEVFNGTQSWYQLNDLAIGTYQIQLRIKDGFGVWSDPADLLISVSTYIPPPPLPIPNLTPTITVISPTNGSTVKGSVTLQGTASDPDGAIEMVEISINGGSWISAEGTDSWSYSWDTTKVDNGTYTILFRSYDGRNYSIVKILDLTVENEPDLKAEETEDDEKSLLMYIGILTFAVILVALAIAYKKNQQ